MSTTREPTDAELIAYIERFEPRGGMANRRRTREDPREEFETFWEWWVECWQKDHTDALSDAPDAVDLGAGVDCHAAALTGENPKDRLGIKKPPLHLIPAAAEIHEAMAMGDGAQKYGSYNWREKKVKATVYVAAARRHLASFFDGEDYDPKSGVHHLGHARACLGIILDAIETGNLADDRPTKGAAAALIERLTAK